MGRNLIGSGRKRSRGILVGLLLLALCAALAGCTPRSDVRHLAGDRTQGRDNNTPGSKIARDYLIRQLKGISIGLDHTGTGDEAYTQSISEGTNVISMIRGTTMPDSYVIVGAHYDHVGYFCRQITNGDPICNGATDNATGVATVLAIARSIASGVWKPRRSVVFALWDREEDGLVGSGHYINNPLVPISKTVAYVNFDIQGANLLPSLRNTSFAVAAESGGPRFSEIVDAAIGAGSLGTEQLSTIFGQGRGDYQSFLNARVPSVFFTDSGGGCYHTTGDEFGIVDFGKLRKQIGIGIRVTRGLANTHHPPLFTAGTPLVTYQDAVALLRVTERGYADRGLLPPESQSLLEGLRQNLRQVVDAGPAVFEERGYAGVVINAALILVNRIITQLPCDGYLAHGAGAAAP